MNVWAFAKHFVGLTVAVAGAATDAVLRAIAGKNSHAERAAWLHRWCAFLLRRLSIDLKVCGRIPDRGLIVCNHLSYLDIIVFSALAPCAFVSKREVRAWPIFGLFAAIAGTIFVDRSRPALAQKSVEEMQATLNSGVRVVLFPEGTSTGGDTVLPFKPALFESAIETQQPITAAHLRYKPDGGDASRLVCYWGEMTFLPHLLRLMGESHVLAVIQIDSWSKIFNDRKNAAIQLQQRVEALHQRVAD